MSPRWTRAGERSTRSRRPPAPNVHAAGRLSFFGEIAGLCRRQACTRHLAPLKKKTWFVYAKPPFAGPQARLADLGRDTHRVAIANSRLITLDERGVTFRYKDYRRDGQVRYRTMTRAADEFIRRFLLPPAAKRGFTASATASCSPARPARPISHAPGS
jgi:hypothetical protein